jgi:serine/threonine protein kinase
MLKSRHTNGPVGERFVVQSQSHNGELVADLVLNEGDECLTAVCRNAARTRKWTEGSSIANVLEAGWLADGRYFQILQLSPNAVAFDEEPRAESQVLLLAKSLVTSLKHLHSSELIHGALSPACVYQDGDEVRLGELWFVHNADGEPLYRELSQYFPATVPEFAWHFMAPEVLLGYPPTAESDVFSLGAVLFCLLTGQPPRDLPALYPKAAMLGALAESPIKSLPRLRPDLNGEFGGIILSTLKIDPGERPSIFLLEDLCEGLVENVPSDHTELKESLR